MSQQSARSSNPREPHLEGPGWFETKVSEAEFSRFKQEMTEFRTEVFAQIRNNGLRWMDSNSNIREIERRVAEIEKLIEPPELTASPYASDNEDDQDEEEDNETGSSSSTSDSGDSESDEEENEYDQDSYYRRRNNDSGDEF